jgi:hypothetical protein
MDEVSATSKPSRTRCEAMAALKRLAEDDGGLGAHGVSSSLPVVLQHRISKYSQAT